MCTPGMAAHDASGGQPGAFEEPPFLECPYGVVRTGRIVPAFVDTQQGRQENLVKTDGQNEQVLEHGSKVGGSQQTCNISR